MGITERRKQILEFIGKFHAKEGFPPSLMEICEALGLASRGSLHKHVRSLEEEGLLESSPGKKRAWRLTEPAWDLIGKPRSLHIPLVGQIAAGTPILADQNIESELPVDPSLFGSDEAFALKVKGDSMIDVKISDGDLAVIKPHGEAENGQIVAVMVEGVETEATLKIFRRRHKTVELHAANEKYEPLIFKGDDLSKVKILGRLIGVIRLKP